MNEESTMRGMVKFAVDRALPEMQKNPRRGLRNLVDLGLLFAKKEPERALTQTAQAVLKDPQSPYFELLERLLAAVDQAAFSELCMHIGYDALVRGGRDIRKNAALLGTPVPFLVEMEMPEDPRLAARLLTAMGALYGLGVRFFLLRCEGGVPEGMWRFLDGHGDAVLFFRLRPCGLRSLPVEDVTIRDNCVAVLDLGDDGFEAACETLRKSHLFFIALREYTGGDREGLFAPDCLARLERARCLVAGSMAAPDCPADVRRGMQERLDAFRLSPARPILPFHVDGDISAISEWVAGHPRRMAIDAQCRAEWVDRDGVRERAQAALDALLSAAPRQGTADGAFRALRSHPSQP